MHVARFMLFLCLPCIARCALITCVACVACAGSLSLRLGQTICLVSHVCRVIACVSSSCHAMVHTCVDDDWVSADQLVESALRPDQLVVSALASRVCASARPLVLVHSHVPCHMVVSSCRRRSTCGVCVSARPTRWSCVCRVG